MNAGPVRTVNAWDATGSSAAPTASTTPPDAPVGTRVYDLLEGLHDVEASELGKVCASLTESRQMIVCNVE